MASLRILALVLSLATTTAFRTIHRKRAKVASNKNSGRVDFLYTYGSPAGAKPPLRMRSASNGCFPGIRVVTVKNTGSGREMDKVPRFPRLVGYDSPMMDLVELDVDTGRQTKFPCSNRTVELPSETMVWDHHDRFLYSGKMAVESDQRLKEISVFACETSFMQNASDAAAQVVAQGWRLVGTANHNGGIIVGGPQVSHLIQNPRTSECVVTFQGSQSLGDWLANINFVPASFCGLQERVHRGFRDHLMRIVKTSAFQNNIRAKLPSCSKVTITGQSLGSALAELFTACVQEAPSSSSDSRGDYSHIGWAR
jgi:hypothetical protein